MNGQITSITNLQTSDTSQNTRLTNIETLNTTQNTRLTNIETLNTTQDTRLTNIETVNTSQDNSIATVLNRVRNMTATSVLTSMSKPLVFNNDGECVKLVGTNTNIAGYDFTTGTRDYASGNASTANKKLIIMKQSK